MQRKASGRTAGKFCLSFGRMDGSGSEILLVRSSICPMRVVHEGCGRWPAPRRSDRRRFVPESGRPPRSPLGYCRPPVATAAQPDRHRAGLFRFPALCLQYLPVKPGPVTAETAAVLARLSWAKILMPSLCTASASEVCPGCILPQAKADLRRSSAPVPGR